MSIDITKSAFKYEGQSYFRDKAENVRLGSYGDKKSPLGKPNYLSVQGNITSENLGQVSSNIVGPYAIEWENYTDSDVNLAISYITKDGGTAGFDRQTARSAKLKLVKIFFNRGPLTTLLNKHADGARNWLASAGNSGRVVGEVWIVMEATLASEITTNGSLSAEGRVNGFKINLSGSSSSTTRSSITIPANTTFAYLLYKVKDWNKDKTQVEALEDDRVGLT
jgi:hypothetical protein